MQLTTKLIDYLNRVFSKDPGRVLAFRLNYDGSSMSWAVSDGQLTTAVVGGSGENVSVYLAGHTISSLAAWMDSQPGYSIPYVTDGEAASLSALTLIDAAGNPANSNGDHLYAFTSVLWAYMNAQASELTTAKAAISEMLLQMAAPTASDTWVDEHGGYYGIPRAVNEQDESYAPRIIAEVIRPRGNGVAIAEAIKRSTGATQALVSDVDAATTAADGTLSYGLFDAEVDVPVDSPLSQDAIQSNTSSIIEAMRDAGTHLRKLRYIRSATLPVYRGAVCLSGHSVAVTEFGWMSVYDGTFTFNGARTYNGVP